LGVTVMAAPISFLNCDLSKTSTSHPARRRAMAAARPAMPALTTPAWQRGDRCWSGCSPAPEATIQSPGWIVFDVECSAWLAVTCRCLRDGGSPGWSPSSTLLAGLLSSEYIMTWEGRTGRIDD
jgi:hypothetical protein